MMLVSVETPDLEFALAHITPVGNRFPSRANIAEAPLTTMDVAFVVLMACHRSGREGSVKLVVVLALAY